MEPACSTAHWLRAFNRTSHQSPALSLPFPICRMGRQFCLFYRADWSSRCSDTYKALQTVPGSWEAPGTQATFSLPPSPFQTSGHQRGLHSPSPHLGDCVQYPETFWVWWAAGTCCAEVTSAANTLQCAKAGCAEAAKPSDNLRTTPQSGHWPAQAIAWALAGLPPPPIQVLLLLDRSDRRRAS